MKLGCNICHLFQFSELSVIMFLDISTSVYHGIFSLSVGPSLMWSLNIKSCKNSQVCQFTAPITWEHQSNFHRAMVTLRRATSRAERHSCRKQRRFTATLNASIGLNLICQLPKWYDLSGTQKKLQLKFIPLFSLYPLGPMVTHLQTSLCPKSLLWIFPSLSCSSPVVLNVGKFALLPRGYFAMSGNIFDCRNQRRCYQQPVDRTRDAVKDSTTGQPPTTKNYQASKSIVLRLRNPDSALNELLPLQPLPMASVFSCNWSWRQSQASFLLITASKQFSLPKSLKNLVLNFVSDFSTHYLSFRQSSPDFSSSFTVSLFSTTAVVNLGDFIIHVDDPSNIPHSHVLVFLSFKNLDLHPSSVICPLIIKLVVDFN